MARALVTVPKTATKGEAIEVRTLIAHAMETGYRVGDAGVPVRRNVIRKFTCRYLGVTVLSVELFPAVAANPYLSFFVVATASGPLDCTWEGDDGFAQTESVAIAVT